MPPDLEFHPLTAERWTDFEGLFGPRGAYGGCWCMFWRLKRADFSRMQGDGNRAAMHAIVDSGEVPGLLAYAAGQPVGWCSVAPRERFGSLNRSPVLKPIDDTPVWSIVCFYIAKEYRGQGLTEALIRAAVQYAWQQGGQVVEAYPVDPQGRDLAPVSSYMGLPGAFARAGFMEVARPSAGRVIMRCSKE
ncbi:MAG: GNAT family N-acetyltransferase [Anaerolineae bacterium]